MRLLFVNQYYPPDVAATAYLLGELTEDLARTDEVWVVSGRPSYNPEAGTFRPQGPRVVRVWSSRFPRTSIPGRFANYGSFVASSLARARSVPRPDVVVALTDPPVIGLVGLHASRYHRVPFVYVCEDIFPDVAVALRRLDSPLTVSALRRLNRVLRDGADRIVAIGRDMAAKLLAEGVPQGKIQVIPNWAEEPGVDGGQVEAVRTRMGWTDAFVVMHAGNVGLAQDLGTLVEAARILAQQREIRFAIVGDGAARPELEARVRSLGLGNVVFLPQTPKEEVQPLLGCADIHTVTLAPGLFGCVVPSKMYGIMSLGRPFIAAVDEGSEPALVVEEHGCGVLVQPGDPAILADGIARMRDMPLQEMGERGRQAFRGLYQRRTATEAYRHLFEEVVQEGPQRGR